MTVLERLEDIWIIIKLFGPIILIFLAIGGFVLVVMPAMNAKTIQNEKDSVIISDNFYSFNDTAIMVKYNYGSWWGDLGGISSTTVTLQNGVNQTLGVSNNTLNNTWISFFGNNGNSSALFLKNQLLTNFTFSGNLGVVVGKEYTISYEVIIYTNNQTRLNPIDIELIESE
jgi:hypothetical protein